MAIAIGIAALLWSGYWLFGSRQATAEVRAWFDSRATDGWTANFGELSTQGYPNRFDTTITAPEIAVPSGAVRWKTPFIQILRLSYKPEHAILIFPGSQTVFVAGQKIAVSSDRFRASTVFEQAEITVLDRANLEADGVNFQIPLFGEINIGKALVAIRKTSALASAHDFAIELRDIDGLNGLAVKTVAIDATAKLNAPLGLDVFNAGGIDVTEITFRRLQLGSDAFDISASGSLIMDSIGLPSGTLDLKIRNSAEVVQLATGLGLMTPENRASIEAELTRVTNAQDTAEPIELQIEVRRGALFLGAVQLR